MSLAAAYSAYLDGRPSGGRAGPLIDALGSAGQDGRAELLARCVEGESGPAVLGDKHGPWAGRRAWLGESLPLEAGEGDLWFDACELGLAMLVPREGFASRHQQASPDDALPPGTSRFLSWHSLAPVRRWQFWAFLQLAPFERREVMEPPPFDLMSPQRISREPELEPITGISWPEAYAFACWFGKTIPSVFGWQSAADLLSNEIFAALWNPLSREWVSDTVAADETARVAITPDTYQLDPDEVYEEEYEGQETPGGPMIVGQWRHEETLGFRTAVTVQLGLVREHSELGSRFGDWQLLGKLRRRS